jgi:uncharacterized protein
MTSLTEQADIIRSLEDFDRHSGNWLERAIFNHRLAVAVACFLVTIALLAAAVLKLHLNASFEGMIPQSHRYIQNYQDNKNELRGLGNVLRVIVENRGGDIFDPDYQDALRRINDELFLTTGVNRPWMRSLWTPAVRWTEITEEGYQGGPVMPESYNGSSVQIDKLRLNIARAGIIGRLVGSDYRSSMIVVPLLDQDLASGQRLDYRTLSRNLENIRLRYERELGPGHPHLRIHIAGFAKVVGDLMEGLAQVVTYFVAAALIAVGIIFAYTRCLRSTILVVSCSLAAVAWQLGLVALFGFNLDPYSILVPFLVFAIGVSHGAQKMNGIIQDIARGTHRVVAARHTFRRLFLAGLTALLADAVGFAVLIVIDIPVIRDLAVTASIGVTVLIFTNLILLPVMLSYTGVSREALRRFRRDYRRQRQEGVSSALAGFLGRFTERRWAGAALMLFAALTAAGLGLSRNLEVGDLDPGAPELRRESRYNLDNAYITAHYSLSSDQFAVIVKTGPEDCINYQTMVEVDRLAWELRQLPGVQTTVFLGDAIRQITAGANEGNPKWLTLARNQEVLNYGAQQASVNNPDLFNTDCSVMPVIAYLADHRADTLDRVVQAVERFADQHSNDKRQFLLAAGNAGIEATTNIVVREANRTMLFYVYGAVALLCFVTFRSWRAVIVAMVPLVITSILCEALMVALDIGVKVATLPVIALGVGIGVDYALYLLSVQLSQQLAGLPLQVAYGRSIEFTGKVVALVGITLAVSVVTWVWSPIKFQADMGILLTFMFLWNMVGALVLIPALSHFLLNEHYQKPSRVEAINLQ